MVAVVELARLAGAVYTGDTSPGWGRADFRAAWEGLLDDGLQAALYTQGSGSVVAFRGTNLSLFRIVATLQDIGADLTLGFGMNSNYFSAAERFTAHHAGTRPIVLTGHSLGGAIAQVVGNRLGLPFATFNAPGVAVWASRNMGEASATLTAVRTVGMAASAVLHPIQAARDVRSAFRAVQGLNVCLDRDPVSKIGVHYGEIVRVPSASTSSNPVTQHSMATVLETLAPAPPSPVPAVASRDSATFH